MAVGIVAGEEGVFAPGRAEQGAADAAEGELAGGIGCVGRGGAGEGAAELADALAESGVGQVEEPADLLARVAGEGEEGGEAEARGKIGERAFARAWFDGRRLRRLLTMSALHSVRILPAAVAALAARGGAGVEGGAVAEDAGEPAAGFRRGEIGAAGFKRSEKRGLQEVVGFLGPAREAAGLCVEISEGAGTGHGRRLPHGRDCGNGLRGS